MAKTILKDTPMYLREIYYEAEARQLIIASTKTYNRLKSALIKARKLQLIDPSLIKTPYDRLPWTYPPEKFTAKEAINMIKKIPKYYTKNFWDDQPKHIEVWVEKISLCDYFRPICEKLGVMLIPCKGDQAISAIWEAKERFDKKITLGKKVIILYFGDFNPSGIHAPEAIKDTLKNWGTTDVEIKRVALLFVDIIKYKLPPNPTKKTTKKDKTLADRLIAKYGKDYNVELDSLKAHAYDEFIKRIETSILNQIDFNKASKSADKVLRARKRLKTIIEEKCKDQFPYLFNNNEKENQEG